MSRTDSYPRPPEILLVEDDDNELELIRIGFRLAALVVNLHRVRDGEECMAYLRTLAGGVRRLPDLVLLDINMPRMNGFEVLNELLQDEDLCRIPTVVLSTSDTRGDVSRAYQLKCNSYVVKPMNFEQFVGVVKGIAHYWFEVVELPELPGERLPAAT